MGCWSGLLLMDMMVLQGSVFQWQFTLTTYEGRSTAKRQTPQRSVMNSSASTSNGCLPPRASMLHGLKTLVLH
ncbi:unnamed protein product [Boreogadus saida]